MSQAGGTDESLSFSLNDAVDHSCVSSVSSLLQACDAATEKTVADTSTYPWHVEITATLLNTL